MKYNIWWGKWLMVSYHGPKIDDFGDYYLKSDFNTIKLWYNPRRHRYFRISKEKMPHVSDIKNIFSLALDPGKFRTKFSSTLYLLLSNILSRRWRDLWKQLLYSSKLCHCDFLSSLIYLLVNRINHNLLCLNFHDVPNRSINP